ncbi:MAG: hypothetical protein GC154_12950 [bacterium]|nr:hypothetical protein [bacterium]
MNLRKIQRFFSSVFLPLVAAVPITVAFMMLTFLHFRIEREQIEQMDRPLVLAARLESGTQEDVLQPLLQKTRQLDHVREVTIQSPIPQWTGDPEYSSEWESLWSSQIGSILYVTAEQTAVPAQLAQELSDQIKQLFNVAEVEWNQRDYEAMSEEKRAVQLNQFHMTWMLFVLLAVIEGSLIFSIPLRFRRRFTILLGAGGAGTQINPESVWMRMMLTQTGLGAAVFLIAFGAGAAPLAMTLQPGGSPGVAALAVQGVICTAALIAAATAIGWWLPPNETEAAGVLRPPVGL